MTDDPIKIPVRHLVEFALREGDLGTAFMGKNRAVEGIWGHQQVQQAREAGYQAEVPVTTIIERQGLAFEISGRIDGIFPGDNPVMLEEIKTTAHDLATLPEDYNPLHWAQAKCYAHIWAEQQNLAQVGVQLTYYHLESQETKTFRQLLSRAELAEFFEHLLAIYVDWAGQVQQWLAIRNDAIDALAFPYANYRRGQRELAVAVYQTIKRRRKLFAQAPTGIGKTIATLFPAVKAIGTELVTKIFYLTAKTLGRTVAEKALDDMRADGLRLKSVTLTAKDKICFCPPSDRDANRCEYARNYYGKLRKALIDAYQHEAFTRPLIEEIAEKHQVCPFEFSLDLALWADCIICDYNYAFDPRVYLRRFFDSVSEPYVFLVDESHNFPDRARAMFSAALDKQTVLALRRMLETSLPPLAEALSGINQALLEKRRACGKGPPEQAALVEDKIPEELVDAVRQFTSQTEVWLTFNHQTEFRQPLLDFFFQCNAYLRAADNFDETYVSYFEPSGKSGLLARLFCLDPAPHLKKAMERSRATIFFSATLLPLDYFERVLTGVTDHPRLVLSSPFPRQNSRVLIHQRVSTKYTQRASSYDPIATTIRSVAETQPGNYLVFFPSYAYMKAVVEILRPQMPAQQLLVQERSMSEAARETFLAQFRAANTEPLIGFAVMGGIFGEGIDLVGERLIGAIVVGVGVPQVCLERNLIKDYFQTDNRQGFEYAYQYPGLNRVMQAAGRVIRTEQDRGVIVLIDERFTQYRYRILFPQEWQHFQAVQDMAGIQNALANFWGATPPKSGEQIP